MPPPPRYFTHYWSNTTWQAYRAHATAGEVLDHAASNLFRARGVSPGDSVYIVTILRGALYVLGKLRVAAVCDQEEAAARLGTLPDDLWPADDHIVADAATPLDFDRPVPPAVAAELRFAGLGIAPRPLKFRSDDAIDPQTLRGVRELTPASAAVLDALLGPLLPVYLPAGLARLAALAEEPGADDLYCEGGQGQVTLNVYERSRAARMACLRHWGYDCVCCGFNFERTYGPDAAGCIHVHHLYPLAARAAEYVVDPTRDLVPVCPNCHTVIHLRAAEPYTVEEVRALLQAAT